MKRFFDHRPLFKEGASLVKTGVSCAMDLSDSFYESVELLTAASRVGARVEIDHVPRSTMARQTKMAPDAHLTEGEDYGLLFTIAPHRISALKKRMVFSVVGQILKSSQKIEYRYLGRKIHPKNYFSHF